MENIFFDIFLRDVFREVFKENGLLYEFFVNRIKKKNKFQTTALNSAPIKINK